MTGRSFRRSRIFAFMGFHTMMDMNEGSGRQSHWRKPASRAGTRQGRKISASRSPSQAKHLSPRTLSAIGDPPVNADSPVISDDYRLIRIARFRCVLCAGVMGEGSCAPIPCGFPPLHSCAPMNALPVGGRVRRERDRFDRDDSRLSKRFKCKSDRMTSVADTERTRTPIDGGGIIKSEVVVKLAGVSGSAKRCAA